MEVREIKETKTIEEVIRTDYIAEDGTVFRDEDECKKYEESALFAVSKKLKRLTKAGYYASQYDIWDECCDEYEVEIFQIDTEEDLDYLRRYLYLKGMNEHPNADRECLRVSNEVTVGHEVIVFWSYDHDYCWTCGNGTIVAFCNYINKNLMRMITPRE